MVPIYDEAIGRGQLLKISLLSGARERITNDLSNYSMSPDLTADGKNVAVVEGNGVSNIWASSSGYSSKLEQITFGQLSMFGAAETNDGKLLFLGDSEIWIMDATGTARASFAKLRAFSVGICGAYVVADVLQDGLMHIVRLNGDGTHEVILATGTLYSPMCSAEGKIVFYYDLSLPQKILSMPIEGGTPVEIAKIPGDGLIGPEEISNDGKMLAYIYERYTPVPAMFLDVISSASGSLLKSFTAPPGANGRMRWSSGDTALDYVLTRDGVDNLWQQKLVGGAPKQVTKFTSGRIFGFNWSKNHKRLLLSRGSFTSDLVLLSHLR
jgi:Tol biopolymer transport system component